MFTFMDTVSKKAESDLKIQYHKAYLLFFFLRITEPFNKPINMSTKDDGSENIGLVHRVPTSKPHRA